MIFWFSLFAGLFSLSGCASREVLVACVQKDWYEIGRRDGAQGQTTDQLALYRDECGGGPLRGNDEMIYLNGRNAGLVEYCRPESAFQLGRAGQPYNNVCPVTVEPPFLAAYRRGQRAREIEQRNRNIDAQIESLSNRLLRAQGSVTQRQLDQQLRKLRGARERAFRELDAVVR